MSEISDHYDKENENVKSDWFYEQKTTALSLHQAFWHRLYVCDVKLSHAKIYTGDELEKKTLKNWWGISIFF